MTLFFDTHAILGLLLNEPRYRDHVGSVGVTHQLNLAEALVKLLRHGMVDGLQRIRGLGLGLVAASEAALVAAAQLKVYPPPGREFSLVDAFGYAVARQMGFRFLTGDPDFEGLDGVEFVKT